MSEASNTAKPGSDHLWVCHLCEYIGTRAEAEAHRIVRGHAIEELDDETTAGILEEWRRVGDPRAAA